MCNSGREYNTPFGLCCEYQASTILPVRGGVFLFPPPLNNAKHGPPTKHTETRDVCRGQGQAANKVTSAKKTGIVGTPRKASSATPKPPSPPPPAPAAAAPAAPTPKAAADVVPPVTKRNNLLIGAVLIGCVGASYFVTINKMHDQARVLTVPAKALPDLTYPMYLLFLFRFFPLSWLRTFVCFVYFIVVSCTLALGFCSCVCSSRIYSSCKRSYNRLCLLYLKLFSGCVASLRAGSGCVSVRSFPRSCVCLGSFRAVLNLAYVFNESHVSVLFCNKSDWRV